MLLALFLVHLAGFVILGLNRREWYYQFLVTTFALLTAAFAMLVFAPEIQTGAYALL